MSNTKKRKWAGYFLEFLMLFLAVTLGFLADNFRENISDRNKEKEYIQSMIEDVEEDEVNIKEAIKINNQRVVYLDSLVNKCYNFSPTSEKVFNLSRYFSQVLIHPEFIAPTELTMQQLKNAGGMRLIKSKEAINEIIRYDSQLKKLADQRIYYENYQNKAIEIGTKIFNLHNLSKAFNNPSGTLSPKDFELINDDKLQLEELGNSVAMYKEIIKYYVVLLKEMDTQGKILIESLEEQYDLK